MNRFLERFTSFLIAARWPLLIFAIVIAALAYGPSQQLRFDRSIEHMFAPGDPLLPPYQRLKERFGGNEIVMAVYQDEHLLDADGRGIERLRSVSQRMKQVDGVRDVLSLAEVGGLLDLLEKSKRRGILRLFGRQRDDWTGPAILNPNSPLAARYRELFAGYTHSADGKTAAVVCMLEPQGSSRHTPRDESIAQSEMRTIDSRAATIEALEKIIGDLPDGLAPGVLAGEPVMVVEGFSLLEKDGRRLGTATTILLGLTILIFFRSLRWLVLPIAVVQWAVVVTRAALVISGLELSMVSSMLTAIVTVVGVATVMHLIVHIREMRTEGLSQREALWRASVLLAGPIFGAIATDVGGFGSLLFASVRPVRDFGAMMVLGSILVIPATCLLAPALALMGSSGKPAKKGWGEIHIGYWLIRSIDAIRSHPGIIAVGTLLVALIASLGVMRLDVETDFTRNFRSGSRVVRAYEFVETHLGGAGVWDVVVPAPEILDGEYLDRIRKLEENLRAIEVDDPTTGQTVPALTKVISLVDALDAVEADRVLALAPPELRYEGMVRAMPVFTAALRSTELDAQGQGRLRIMLRARERQPAEQKQGLINDVTRVAKEAFPDAEVTGFFVLLTNLIESMLRDQWITLAVASAAIMAMVFIGFWSWKYAVVAMIPNIVPIYMVMGLLGWLGLKINMGAAMIAAVSMGMSVDSSIHYYAAFRRHRREGKTVHAALVQCQQSVGLAMIFSTIALIIGFGALVTSEFVPTIYFGALMSLAMLGGMLGNLIVLPLLLSWTERE